MKLAELPSFHSAGSVTFVYLCYESQPHALGQKLGEGIGYTEFLYPHIHPRSGCCGVAQLRGPTLLPTGGLHLAIFEL